MEPQTFQNNDFDKKMMQYCKLPSRDKRETSAVFQQQSKNSQVSLLQDLAVEKWIYEQSDFRECCNQVKWKLWFN